FYVSLLSMFMFVYFIYIFLLMYFFFQAEDGIRDRNVTGVQTCALPISNYGRRKNSNSRSTSPPGRRWTAAPTSPNPICSPASWMRSGFSDVRLFAARGGDAQPVARRERPR